MVKDVNLVNKDPFRRKLRLVRSPGRSTRKFETSVFPRVRVFLLDGRDGPNYKTTVVEL